MSIEHKRNILAVSCAVLLGVPLLLQGAALSKADVGFLKMAARANMTEAHLGQMAETQASEQAVKDFGHTLTKDHTNAYETLTVLADKTGETIPKAIGRVKDIELLTHLKGKAFDRAFTQEEVQSHKRAIIAFKNEAAHGENPDVKAWAQAVIPTLEGHLQDAESLAKLEKAGK